MFQLEDKPPSSTVLDVDFARKLLSQTGGEKSVGPRSEYSPALKSGANEISCRLTLEDLEEVKRARGHLTHCRQQLFGVEGLVEKSINPDGMTGFARFQTAGRSYDQDL